jgi:peptidoglycan hydrolase-like protein with peptidoglycan-binding domain
VAAALAAPLLLLAAPAPDAVGATRTCSSTTAVANRPTLRYGDTGSCVKVLQNILLGKGYSIGSSSATGTFGSGTLGAVRRYQSTKLTLVIDGVVGPDDLEPARQRRGHHVQHLLRTEHQRAGHPQL